MHHRARDRVLASSQLLVSSTPATLHSLLHATSPGPSCILGPWSVGCDMYVLATHLLAVRTACLSSFLLFSSLFPRRLYPFLFSYSLSARVALIN